MQNDRNWHICPWAMKHQINAFLVFTDYWVIGQINSIFQLPILQSANQANLQELLIAECGAPIDCWDWNM